MVVRTDLSIPQQLCQAVHAAHESGIKFGNPDHITSVVICGVPNEDSLISILSKTESKGIKAVLFKEPDINNQATAFATEPITNDNRKIFSNLKLWGGK